MWGERLTTLFFDLTHNSFSRHFGGMHGAQSWVSETYRMNYCYSSLDAYGMASYGAKKVKNWPNKVYQFINLDVQKPF